jgi:hypothetical protein
MVLFVQGMNVNRIAEVSLYSVGYWSGTRLFAVLSVMAFMFTLFKSEEAAEVGRLVWVHSLMVSSACVMLMLYWLSFGLIGLKFWAY